MQDLAVGVRTLRRSPGGDRARHARSLHVLVEILVHRPCGIGVLTLALACLGIFGVVSYGVALRTKEIGIRVALGAQQPSLLRAIVRQVLTPVGIGAAIGLVLAIPTGIALRSEPFYLENADPVAFAAALAVFAGAGTLAALVPALATLRNNPIDALRHQ